MALSDDDFKTIEELGPKWPYNWVSSKGLAPYIKRLGDNAQGIEIGTCRAESTHYILDNCPNVSKIYTVDPYTAYEDWDATITQDTLDRFMIIAQKNLSKFDGRVEMIRKPSIEAAADFKDESMDFIFVDGDHSYEGTLADCIAYYPKLKKGGFFCGHDYNSIKAVADAVNAFRYEEKIKSPFNISLNSTFFWYK